ncbi:flagellar hook-basal body complex protein FliE [Litoreibacter roseus]|uniref:Flagellar hook-basal body protein FliE n=1 Tax=Litoreibacter roseus TaxID=2601869 RepID=A0A6N6JDI0_9RHOB|nr:flagellar hook-basal body complex protein FliE [Litoreibacter roseus]GFE64413.1 flagellar hook-basal body protein FliE [Litoreibacter roseus]
MDTTSTLALRAYDSSKPATQPDAMTGEAQIGRAADDFAKVLQEGEDTAKAAMVGGADPHALVEALAQSELAIETAVSVRDKVVQAYQEILRMPV